MRSFNQSREARKPEITIPFIPFIYVSDRSKVWRHQRCRRRKNQSRRPESHQSSAGRTSRGDGRQRDGQEYTTRCWHSAGDISSDPPAREMDMLLSTGEQVSVALVAMAIHEIGREGGQPDRADRSG